MLNNIGFPAFDVIKPHHIESAIDAIISHSETVMIKLEDTPSVSWETVVWPLEEMEREISATWGPVSHLIGVLNSPELRAEFEKAQPKMIQLGLRISQSKKVYDAIKIIQKSKDFEGFSESRKRIIEKHIHSARLAGIELEGASRQRFNEISQKLSELGTKFSNNVLDSIKDYSMEIVDPKDVEGMPESFKQGAAEKWNSHNKTNTATAQNGPWLVTLDIPSFLAFMKHCPNREKREKLYMSHISVASKGPLDNSQMIAEILDLRAEKSKILGFKDYAELSLSSKMVNSSEEVYELLEKLATASKPSAEKEHEELTDFATEAGLVDSLKPWDLHFYSERLRESKFSYTDDQLRPYFPLPAVLDGLFSLVNTLFGVQVSQKTSQVPTWHKDVLFFEIKKEGSLIASFYLDPYSRPENKRGGAWMNTCVDRGYYKDEVLLPVAYLICNSTPPVGDDPSLLTFREVETLFHEFGHGLQHMLTTVDDSSVSGINGVEWDAVELPSQFMENWCYHKETLIGMTSHYKTGEKLPEELFLKVKESKNYRSAYNMLRQLHFATIDMTLHQSFDTSQNVFETNRQVASKILIEPPLPEDRFLCGFQHIFAGGYAAGYYSYKWAEVLSADAFSAFEEAGLDMESIKKIGKKFKDTVLALGGSEHPQDVFKKFRGRKPDPTHLLRHSGLI